jgi:hypothetical protein
MYFYCIHPLYYSSSSILPAKCYFVEMVIHPQDPKFKRDLGRGSPSYFLPLDPNSPGNNVTLAHLPGAFTHAPSVRCIHPVLDTELETPNCPFSPRPASPGTRLGAALLPLAAATRPAAAARPAPPRPSPPAGPGEGSRRRRRRHGGARAVGAEAPEQDGDASAARPRSGGGGGKRSPAPGRPWQPPARAPVSSDAVSGRSWGGRGAEGAGSRPVPLRPGLGGGGIAAAGASAGRAWRLPVIGAQGHSGAGQGGAGLRPPGLGAVPGERGLDAACGPADRSGDTCAQAGKKRITRTGRGATGPGAQQP